MSGETPLVGTDTKTRRQRDVEKFLLGAISGT
jgi:hypothetical protein